MSQHLLNALQIASSLLLLFPGGLFCLRFVRTINAHGFVCTLEIDKCTLDCINLLHVNYSIQYHSTIRILTSQLMFPGYFISKANCFKKTKDSRSIPRTMRKVSL